MIIQKLNEYIKINGLKKSFVANKIGVSSVFLSQVINKRVEPSKDLEERIREFIS
jgi:transcriptional regulator with XRE-family HTH domain